MSSPADLPAAPTNPQISRIASEVHLLHVTDRAFRPSLAAIIRGGQIPTSSAAENYCGNHARFVELQLAHPHCVYFYAGRASDLYGSVALAFPWSIEGSRFISASPFDSGGMVKPDGEVEDGFHLDLDVDDLAHRVGYCRETLVSAPTPWRTEFAKWLGQYFAADPAAYWSGNPLPPGPKNLYNSGNGWQAWTWEVRLSGGTSALDAEAWSCGSDYVIELDQFDEHLGEDRIAALAEFRRRNLTPIGSPEYCQELEAWTRNHCESTS